MNTSVVTLNVMQILRTFTTFTQAAGLQLICAHPTDALEVLYFQGPLPKHQGGVFYTFCTLPGHILHLLQTFQTFRSSIYLAHLADAPEVLGLPGHIPEHHGCLFQIFRTLLQHVLHLAY